MTCAQSHGGTGLTTPWRRWGLAAYACAVAFALGIGYYLFRMPFQVNDNVASMLQLRASSLSELIEGNLFGKAYLRPFLWGGMKVLFDLSQGHYYLFFKAFHLLQVIALAVLFVRMLNVRDAASFAAVPLACTVLFGIHTFRPLVIEAFPVNMYLTIVVCCLAAFNLSLARSSPVVDVAAAVLFAFAALTLESGLLVWICFVVAYLAGARGVSRAGLGVVSALFVAYFVFRFGIAHVGGPGLMERPTGFGFARLEPQELVARFGVNPWPLYAYNIVCAALTVLFGEPRRGVWELSDRLLVQHVYHWPEIFGVMTLSLTSAIVIGYSLTRVRSWLTGHISAPERALVLFWVVLAANAVMSYPYDKDEIMSPSGLFYAASVYCIFTELVVRNAQLAINGTRSVIVGLLVAALAGAWSWRAVETGFHLHLAALRYRGDWAQVAGWKASNHESQLPGAAAFIEQLEATGVATHVPSPYLSGWQWDRVFDLRLR